MQKQKHSGTMSGLEVQLWMHAIIILIVAIMTVQLTISTTDVSTGTVATTSGTQVKENVNVGTDSSTEVQTSERADEVKESEQPTYPEFAYSKDWSEEDAYLLAKIAMAEAEGESLQTKIFVILTVLNRAQLTNEFPDTIEEVIFQKRTANGKTTYQFSPVMPGGRWWRVEPNAECWEAVQIVQEALYDCSEGALYFESCANEDNWHSRNLEFLYQSDNMRFYK